jgi:hypothetical protein
MTEGLILPFMVRFAIEVKMSKNMEHPALLRGAIRESVVQLFGLCASNEVCTPCVLLTNLNQKHYVISLVLPNPDVLRFQISAQRCTSLWNAIQLANEIGKKPSISKFFGRSATPSNSDDGMLEIEAGLDNMSVHSDDAVADDPNIAE